MNASVVDNYISTTNDGSVSEQIFVNGNITASQAASLAAKLSTESSTIYLFAAVTATAAATLVSDLTDSSHNKLTITVGTGAGSSATAAQLNAIKGKTTESVRTGNITTVTGNISDMSTFIGSITSYIENDGLTARAENNYTFTPTSATQSAADLNTLNGVATNISLTNVTTISSSSLSNLDTLATAIGNNEFTNDDGFTTIAVSDSTIDATSLATTIDSYDVINAGATTNMTLASGATVNVDAGEITHMLADETAGRLTISDQDITVNNAGTITVDTANLLMATTTGVVTATIVSTETLTELGTLTDGVGQTNNLTITIREARCNLRYSSRFECN